MEAKPYEFYKEEGIRPRLDIKPEKLIAKIPMSQVVIDVRGRFFRYSFPNGKLRYIFFGSAYMNK